MPCRALSKSAAVNRKRSEFSQLRKWASPPAQRGPGVRFAHALTPSRRAVARRELDFDGGLSYLLRVLTTQLTAAIIVFDI